MSGRLKAAGAALAIAVGLVVATPVPAGAASFTAVATGDWNDAATWGGAVPPPSGSVITIPASIRVDIPAGTTVALDRGSLRNEGFLLVLGTLDAGVGQVLDNAAGADLHVAAGTLEVGGSFDEEATMTNAGKLGNSGRVSISVWSTLASTGNVINSGAFAVSIRATATNLGTFTNNDTLTVAGLGTFDRPRGTFVNRGSFVNAGSGSRVTALGAFGNSSTSTQPATLTNHGVIRTDPGETNELLFNSGTGTSLIDNFGLIDLDGTFTSNGSGGTQTLRNRAGAEIRTNNIRFNLVTGSLVNDAGGLVTIEAPSGRINNDAVIDNAGEIANGATLQNDGVVRARCGSAFTGNPIAGSPAQDWCDHAPPDLETGGDRTVEATGPDGASVSFVTPVKDDKDPAPVVRCSPTSGSIFPLGDTLVSCTATDRVGNSTSASFTISVVDRIAPALTLLGAPAVTVVENNEFEDGGAVALDIVDGDVTADIVVSGVVDTATPGTYTLTYTITDDARNVATATRTVHVITVLAGTTDLIDDIGELGLTTRERDDLQRPLRRARALLSDSKPNNDGGACGQYDAFDELVGDMVADGRLAATTGDDLKQRSAMLAVGLGCV